MTPEDAPRQAPIGTSVPGKEAERLLTGRGCYVEDVVLPGMLHVAFVRSTHAHAHIGAVRRERARGLPGVVAVLTADDCPELAAARPGLLEPGTLNNPYSDLTPAAARALLPP